MMKVENSILIDSFGYIAESVDKNNPKMELNGALVDIQDGTVTLVSTDTRRLYVVTMDVIDALPDQQIIINGIGVKRLLKTLKGHEGPISIEIEKKHILFMSKDIRLRLKLINGRYPDFRRTLPADIHHSTTVQKKDMLECIDTTSILCSDVEIEASDGTLSMQTIADGRKQISTACDSIGEIPKLWINSKYIAGFCKHADDKIIIGVNDPDLPILLEVENKKAVIMPIMRQQ